MKTIIESKNFGEERALYALKDACVRYCSFSGEEDGESALKETRNIELLENKFKLRYPLWHAEGFDMSYCTFYGTARAPIWYASYGKIYNCTLECIKALRECEHVSFDYCNIESEEFGWKCNDITLTYTNLTGAYAFLDSKNIKASNLDFKGKYSFQYVENLEITDSVLDTKDAFWHAKNVTVRNSTLKGEYLAWFSDSLTLINCKIIGTQPFCYCKKLRLIDCEMVDTDLSFENSEVEATVKGSIMSVKNPMQGYIVADAYGEIIFDENAKEPRADVKLR